MKRYETLSKEDIIKAFNFSGTCTNCILNYRCEEVKNKSNYYIPCDERMTKYMYEELENKERWKRIKCNDDLTTLYIDFCHKAGSKTGNAFYKYLLEKIPDSD